MKKVKYVPADHISYINLTYNKVYDVISCIDDVITLLDDDGFKDYFPMYSESDEYGKVEFVDVTTQYRNEVIDNILE